MTRYTTYEISINGVYEEEEMKKFYENKVDKKEYPTYEGWVHDMLRSGVFDKKEITDEEIEKLKNKIKQIIEDNEHPNEDGVIEMFVDYNEEIGDMTLREISNSEDPKIAFSEKLCEWEIDNSDYYWDELKEEIKNNLTPHEEFIFSTLFDDIWEWVKENYNFEYDPKDFDKQIEINLMLDTGDLNYDFTCNNILNYCNYYRDEETDKNSSIFWLARQFKKLTKLKEAIKRQFREDEYYVDREKESDPFIKSVVQELENLPSHMSTLTFLLRMNLLEYLDLMETIKSEQDLNESYTYEDRKGTGYLIISKDTMCGLFNPWSGSGSVLEIELPDDLKIPFKAIWDVEIETGKSKYGYSVDDVYGLVGSCWNGTVKEIHSMTEEEIDKLKEMEEN